MNGLLQTFLTVALAATVAVAGCLWLLDEDPATPERQLADRSEYVQRPEMEIAEPTRLPRIMPRPVEATLRLRRHRRGSCVVELTGELQGNPRFLLAVLSEQSGATLTKRWIEPRQDGRRFRFGQLRSGRHWVTIALDEDGLQHHYLQRFRLPAQAETERRAELSLQTLTVRVEVRHADRTTNESVAGLTVRLERLDDEGWSYTGSDLRTGPVTTNDAGQIAFEQLGPGRYRIVVQHDGLSLHKELRLQRSQTVPFILP